MSPGISPRYLLLQGLFGKYLYASAYHHKDCHFRETYDHAFSDPAAVHLLSTETLRSISTGCQYTRVEKTAKVSDWTIAQRYLNVCTNAEASGQNCSTCEKCCRTLLTLELLGGLERFGKVFNISSYRSVRSAAFLSKCLDSQDDPFCKEIADLWRERSRDEGRTAAGGLSPSPANPAFPRKLP